MSTVKTLVIAACVIVLLPTGVSFAQHRLDGANPNEVAAAHDIAWIRAKKAHRKKLELDAAHKAALKKIKTPPAPTDPWATVR
jgi:hypothetical protein